MVPITDFTPLAALAGGMLTGLAVVLLLSLTGRLVGVGGLAAGLKLDVANDWSWRMMFLAGLLIGAGSYAVITGDVPRPRAGFPRVLLILAGLLVGYGTVMSRGCTSGHGICGLARRSGRSLVATAVLLGTAMLTTFAVRHWPGWSL